MIAKTHSFGTDVTALGGTDQIDGYYETGLLAAVALADCDNRKIDEDDTGEEYIGLEKFGFVYGWCLSRFDGWGLLLKYQRIKKSQFNFDFNITPCESLSGFV